MLLGTGRGRRLECRWHWGWCYRRPCSLWTALDGFDQGGLEVWLTPGRGLDRIVVAARTHAVGADAGSFRQPEAHLGMDELALTVKNRWSAVVSRVTASSWLR